MCIYYTSFLFFLFLYAVLDFGASGNGATDNVKAFRNSLDATSAGQIRIIIINAIIYFIVFYYLAM